MFLVNRKHFRHSPTWLTSHICGHTRNVSEAMMLSLTKAITSDPIDQNSVLHTLPISVKKQNVLIHRAEDIHQDIPHHHQSNPLIAQLEICIKRFTAHTMGSQWLGALPRLAKLRRPAQVGSWVPPTRDQTVVERDVGAPRTVPREAPTEAASRAGRAGNLWFRPFSTKKSENKPAKLGDALARHLFQERLIE